MWGRPFAGGGRCVNSEAAMNRDKSFKMLRGGMKGIVGWNRRRRRWTYRTLGGQAISVETAPRNELGATAWKLFAVFLIGGVPFLLLVTPGVPGEIWQAIPAALPVAGYCWYRASRFTAPLIDEVLLP